MRRHVTCLFLLGVAVLLMPRLADAQDIDPALRADIVKLMEATGSAKIGQQMASAVSQQFLDSFTQGHPDLPPRVLEIAKEVLEEEIAKAFQGPDSLVMQLVPIYAKHFSHEDIRGMLAFYDSDLGRRAIAEMPALLQESMQVGRRWGADVGPRVQAAIEERLKAEGLKP